MRSFLVHVVNGLLGLIFGLGGGSRAATGPEERDVMETSLETKRSIRDTLNDPGGRWRY